MVLASILLSGAAAEAMAATEVRLLHAIPGGPDAQLQLSGAGQPSDPVGFGQATDYIGASSARATATVVVDGEQLGGATEIEADGRYTLVARKNGDTQVITLIRDGEPTPGKTRWRMVHAAPEIDEAELLLGEEVIGRLALDESSEYGTEEPRAASISVRRPGEDEPLAEESDVQLVAGTAQTAYLVGSGGEPTGFVVLQDSASAPQEAPDTGKGGLVEAGRPAWLAALLAAALAAGTGGVLYSRRTRR